MSDKNFAVAGILRPSADGAHLFSILRALQVVGVSVCASDDLLALCKLAAVDGDAGALDGGDYDYVQQVMALGSLLGTPAPSSGSIFKALMKCGGGNVGSPAVSPIPFAFVLPVDETDLSEDLAGAFPTTFGTHARAATTDAEDYEEAIDGIDESSESQSFVELPPELGSSLGLVSSPAVLATTVVKNILAASVSHLTIKFPEHGMDFNTLAPFKTFDLAFADPADVVESTFASAGVLHDEIIAMGEAYGCTPLGYTPLCEYGDATGGLTIDIDLTAFFVPDIALAFVSEASAYELTKAVEGMPLLLVNGTTVEAREGVDVNLRDNTTLVTSSILTYLDAYSLESEDDDAESEDEDGDVEDDELHCGDKECGNGCGGACAG